MKIRNRIYYSLIMHSINPSSIKKYFPSLYSFKKSMDYHIQISNKDPLILFFLQHIAQLIYQLSHPNKQLAYVPIYLGHLRQKNHKPHLFQI